MKEDYPSLARRYFASIIDVVVVITLVSFIIKVLKVYSVDVGPLWLLAFSPAVIYEPVLTSKFVTLGQFLFRFRIRDLSSKNRIGLGQAYGRLIIKFALGAISMLTIPADQERRAIHDQAMRTIALNSNMVPNRSGLSA